MNTHGAKLLHLTGEQAYIVYWMAFHECKVALSTIKILNLNLEVIITDDGELLAFRYEPADELKPLVKYDGEWIRYKEENISPTTRLALEEMIYECS